LLYRLQALSAVDENVRRTKASQLVGTDYQKVLATYRPRSTVDVVAFSPEGDRVLTGSGDYTARLWDARSGKLLGEPLRHENRVSAVAFSPEGIGCLRGAMIKPRGSGTPARASPWSNPCGTSGRFWPSPSAPRGTGC
jgi:WD40 repeat protein